MKKRVILLLLVICFTVGCSNMTELPSRKVENYMSKYQNLDAEVLTQLDLVLDNNSNLDDDERKEYKALLQKQYQNLSYKIIDEKINGSKAKVVIEIEVYDYKTSNLKAEEYYNTHRSEFKSNKDYEDYKIKKMKDVVDKSIYKITFNLTKQNNKWVINNLTDIDRKKIHGLY